MNTDNANRYLDSMQINDRSVWDNKDNEHPLDFMLEDYHQEQLKILSIANVGQQSELFEIIADRLEEELPFELETIKRDTLIKIISNSV